MKLHLVDGTYELFRAFYGAPSRRNDRGMEVGAAVGLVRTLLALLRQKQTTHVACAFDTVVESFRNGLFEGYKTGEGVEPDLWAQFPLAERVVSALGIVVWSMVKFEADDALATAAARWEREHSLEQIVLCSPDKDLSQCVRGVRVVMLDRQREKVLDEEGVVEKFGVPPESIPDWLALVGDPADGIPGLPGWGKKSAALILAQYQHLEEIPADPLNWAIQVRSAQTLARTLNRLQSEALLYRQLATLREDVPLEQDLDDLRWNGFQHSQLKALSQELGFPRFLERISF